MASVSRLIPVFASKEALLALIRDQAQRRRFLPDGWTFHRTLTDGTDQVGSQMEIDAWIGPGPVRQLVQVLAIDENHVVEGPPTADNYVTTWTVAPEGERTWVQLEMRFQYNDLMGEFFVKRRLRKAFRQALERLKALAEAQPTAEA